MARLQTVPFELVSSAAEGSVHSTSGSPSITGSAVRSGARGLRVAAASTYLEFNPAGIANTNRDFYSRFYFRTSANPDNIAALYTLLTSGNATIGRVVLTTSGTLQLQNSGGTQVGSDSVALTANQWYRIEPRFRVNSAGAALGTLELLLDGVSVASAIGSASCGTTAPAWYRIGNNNSGAITQNLDFDDVSLNDDQGANQNTYAGAGNIILLKPISDNASVGFTAGAGSASNLWDAVNNTPPVGVALASATNISQIKDATNNATDTYDANCETYATYINADDTIALTQAVANGGNSSTTSRTLAVKQQSNPSSTEGTVASGGTAAATYPTGWSPIKDTVVYFPVVTRTASPVVRVRKGTASTDSMMYDLIGLYVEYYTPVPRQRARQVKTQVRHAPAVFSS